MILNEAIKQCLTQIPHRKLDERMFFNILKDFRAFSNYPATQNIVRAFITKGYLRRIWTRQDGWQLKSLQELSDFMGFQKNLVQYVINEFEKGFENFTPVFNSEDKLTSNYSIDIPSSDSFKSYSVEELTPSHPPKPIDFNCHVGDIIMAKNGTAKIVSISEDFFDIVYLKAGDGGQRRTIYYDEKYEYIITPGKDFYICSRNGRCFYISETRVDNGNVKLIGTYADRIFRTTLMPYFIMKNGFEKCEEQDFLIQCSDIELFNNFKTEQF